MAKKIGTAVIPTKAKLANVVNVLKAPFTGGKVVVNSNNPVVSKILGTVANHPLATAAVAGTVANIPKAVALYKSTQTAKNAAAVMGKVAPGVLKSPNTVTQATQGSPGLIKSAATAGSGVLSKIKTVASAGSTTLTSTVATTSGSTPRMSSTTRRTRFRSKRSRKSHKKGKKKHYGTARQYARKGGKSVRYTKNGQPYIILSDGRARFVKGRRKK